MMAKTQTQRVEIGTSYPVSMGYSQFHYPGVLQTKETLMLALGVARAQRSAAKGMAYWPLFVVERDLGTASSYRRQNQE